MAFYRTYRPQVIDDMDNAQVRALLSSLLTKDRAQLPHAYLFTGPKGTGKTTAARLIAKLFNCEKLGSQGPCGDCESCKTIATGANIDVLEIDAASNRGIDEIRELRSRIGLAPVHGAYKIFIIDEVHMLTTEAFNALLKTLEEPPAHAVFVLATTDPQKIPDTIISRCMHLVFARATADELIHVLTRIAKTEKVKIDAEAVAEIAHVADGSFRDAAKLLEQMSFVEGAITVKTVRESLALSDSGQRVMFLSHLAKLSVKDALRDVSELVNNGKDIKGFIVDVLGDLEKMLVRVASGDKQESWTIETIQKAIVLFTRSFSELKFTPIEQLPIELAVVDFCATPQVSSRDARTPSPTPPEVTQTVKSSAYKDPVVVRIPQVAPVAEQIPDPAPVSSGMLTFEKLVDHWPDVIAATKPFNHSIAGVLRSSRPKAVGNGIVTIEAFYKFHQEKLSEMNARQMLSDLLKKLFGEKVKVEIVLGSK
jgi:DNA polymerase-3 subunit gamma/tau